MYFVFNKSTQSIETTTPTLSDAQAFIARRRRQWNRAADQPTFVALQPVSPQPQLTGVHNWARSRGGWQGEIVAHKESGVPLPYTEWTSTTAMSPPYYTVDTATPALVSGPHVELKKAAESRDRLKSIRQDNPDQSPQLLVYAEA